MFLLIFFYLIGIRQKALAANSCSSGGIEAVNLIIWTSINRFLYSPSKNIELQVKEKLFRKDAPQYRDWEKNEKLKVSSNSELFTDCEEEEATKTKIRFLD